MKEVKIINKSNNPLPKYATEKSAGLDIRAFLPEGSIRLEPMERRLVLTGLYVALPDGYEAQVRPRSGLALKHGITVLNSPGTVDADYRGEIGVILVNLGDKPFVIENGERIAQLVISEYTQVKFVEVDKLDKTDRGEGGFGHSGVN